MRSAKNNWDFWTSLPEALHQVTIVMSDRGIPASYRLGTNHHLIPVNPPRCPVHSYHRDGTMRVDGNYGSTLGYEPNSDNEWAEQAASPITWPAGPDSSTGLNSACPDANPIERIANRKGRRQTVIQIATRDMLMRCFRLSAFLLAAALLAGCASLAPSDPLQVTVVGIDPLPGQGLELRLLVRLRVQNPNEAPVDYDGVSLQLDVQDKTFATGVSDKGGNLPAFGESLISVPVSVSAMRMARQFTGMLDGKPVEQISYKLTGKLGGSLLGARRFEAQGEFALSGATTR